MRPSTIILALHLILATTPAAQEAPPAAVVDAFIAAFNASDHEAMYRLVAPGIRVFRLGLDSLQLDLDGAEAFRTRLEQQRRQFEMFRPRIEVLDRLVSDFLVIQRERRTLHPPDGDRFSFTNTIAYRVRDGRIIRRFDLTRMRNYLRDRKVTKLRRRLEADAKSLFALYQYGRLHGAVRLRWGFLDEMIPAPWVHRDEPRLYGLMRRAHEMRAPLEVVVGSAPGWADPWSRARPAYVRSDEPGWRWWLEDEEGYPIDEADVQLARLVGRRTE